MSKYHNKKTYIDGYTFDSIKESRHYLILKSQKDIKEFLVHPVFKFPCGIKYIADFQITYKDGRIEIIDIKGFKTDVYRLKRKMMKNCLGKDIVEI